MKNIGDDVDNLRMTIFFIENDSFPFLADFIIHLTLLTLNGEVENNPRALVRCESGCML